MANLHERRNKKGQLISYSVRVYRGRDINGKQLTPYTATFRVEPGWQEKTARKKAQAFANVFEQECKQGLRTDNRQRFDQYCEKVIHLKEQRGLKHSTVLRYKELVRRIYPHIGHVRLCDLQVEHLNDLYTALSAEGLNKKTGGRLSAKTVIEHHCLISCVLEQAFKEKLIPLNIAHRAQLPRLEKREVNYFQPSQIEAIKEALEHESPKWNMLVHLLLVTGARRGELLGLKWDKVELEQKRIYICNNLLYAADRGVYEDTPKTETSQRYICLPDKTVAALREYRRLQKNDTEKGFVFCRKDGRPLHPCSVTDYLTKFARKHGLPHINAHAFRHTMASLLYFNGADSVSVSKRLGHAQVSTTVNIRNRNTNTLNRQSYLILNWIPCVSPVKHTVFLYRRTIIRYR